MAKKSFFSKLFGAVADFVAPVSRGKRKEPPKPSTGFKGFELKEPTFTGVRPVDIPQIPTPGMFDYVPSAKYDDFEELNKTQFGREIIFSDPSLPMEVRQQALRDWLEENPHPHRSDLGGGRNNNNSWRNFRELYPLVYGE